MAERPAALVSDAPGHGAGGDASRLQQDHGPGIQQRRRNARRLASAGRRGQDEGATARKISTNLADMGVDRQRLEARVRIGRQNRRPMLSVS